MLLEQQTYYSFKNIRGTPQYKHNHLLDVWAKVRQFGCYTFFLTLAAIPKFWPEIIQMFGRRYGKHFTIEEVNKLVEKWVGWKETLLLQPDKLIIYSLNFGS